MFLVKSSSLTAANDQRAFLQFNVESCCATDELLPSFPSSLKSPTVTEYPGEHRNTQSQTKVKLYATISLMQLHICSVHHSYWKKTKQKGRNVHFIFVAFMLAPPSFALCSFVWYSNNRMISVLKRNQLPSLTFVLINEDLTYLFLSGLILYWYTEESNQTIISR